MTRSFTICNQIIERLYSGVFIVDLKDYHKLLNNGVCRDCDVWYELADSHTFKCNPISRSMIKSIQKKRNY